MGVQDIPNTMQNYTAESLERQTIAEIQTLAGTLGYVITKSKKNDIIEEFLNQQESED